MLLERIYAPLSNETSLIESLGLTWDERDESWRTQYAQGGLARPGSWFHSGREGWYHVHSIKVHPNHRGLGHGRAIMEKLIALADSRQMHLELRVYVTNTPAVRLYESVGFEVDPDLPQSWYDDPVHFMVRPCSSTS